MTKPHVDLKKMVARVDYTWGHSAPVTILGFFEHEPGFAIVLMQQDGSQPRIWLSNYNSRDNGFYLSQYDLTLETAQRLFQQRVRHKLAMQEAA